MSADLARHSACETAVEGAENDPRAYEGRKDDQEDEEVCQEACSVGERQARSVPERAYVPVKDGLHIDDSFRHGLRRTGPLQLFVSKHDFLLEIMPLSDVAAICLQQSQIAVPSALPGILQADAHVKNAAAPPATVNDNKSSPACPDVKSSSSSTSGTTIDDPTISVGPSEVPKSDLPDSTAPLVPPQDDLAQSEALDDPWLVVTAGTAPPATRAMRKVVSSEAVSSRASGGEGLQDRGDL